MQFEFGKVQPMLCKLQGTRALATKDMVWEQKHDGFRALAFVDRDSTYRLQARSGTEKTRLFPELGFDVSAPCILDGEITCGSGKFIEVQHRVNAPKQIELGVKKWPATFNVFDVLSLNGDDLTGHVWTTRRTILEGTVRETGNVKLTTPVQSGNWLHMLATRNGWEGIVGKHMAGVYTLNKRGWVKLKLWQTGVFTVVGYTAGTGKFHSNLGALVLANGTQVGSGFTDTQRQNMWDYLRSRVKTEGTVVAGKCTTIEPFNVEVKYNEVTNCGQLRWPIYVSGGIEL